MPAAGKGKKAQRYPAKNRGIMGNGKMQKGGGSSGKSKGGMGMSSRSGSGKGMGKGY